MLALEEMVDNRQPPLLMLLDDGGDDALDIRIVVVQGLTRHPGAFGSLVSLVRELRGRRFDAVLDLQGLFRSASLAWLSRCPQRFGPVWRREFAHHFYTTTVPAEPEWVHVIDYYMKIHEAMGAEDRRVEFVLPEKPAAAQAVEGLLSKHSIERDRYAVIIPGSAQVSKCWPVERFEYEYRTSVLKRRQLDAVILTAQFQMVPGDPEEIHGQMNEFTLYRRSTQPPGASMGSMFKNPPDDYAGRLIEAAGLKGTRIGGAEISPVHANFFINHEGANAADVFQLIQLAQETVTEKFGVELELEIEFIGER